MLKKLFLISLILIIIYTFKITDQNIIIPESAIRLRVIPNSNSAEDIYIKEQVKSYLEDNIYTITKNINDITEARNIIKENIPSINSNVDNIFLVNDYYLTYDINYGNNYFPQKIYKGVNYKEGYYESLVITIGEGKGDNWWCVLFPNFCLIDKENTIEYKSIIKKIYQKYSKKD